MGRVGSELKWMRMDDNRVLTIDESGWVHGLIQFIWKYCLSMF